MDPTSANSAVGTFFVVLLLAGVVVNALSAYIYSRLVKLVIDKSSESSNLIGDNVALLYAKYLFGQLMAGSFFTPNTVVLGNPENDRVVRAVKDTD